jgi:hypothetical protein
MCSTSKTSIYKPFPTSASHRVCASVSGAHGPDPWTLPLHLFSVVSGTETAFTMWSGRWPQLALVNAKEKEQEKSAPARTGQRVRAWAGAYRSDDDARGRFWLCIVKKIFFVDMQHASHRVKKARAIEIFFFIFVTYCTRGNSVFLCHIMH